jgi:hypothetical protein
VDHRNSILNPKLNFFNGCQPKKVNRSRVLNEISIQPDLDAVVRLDQRETNAGGMGDFQISKSKFKTTWHMPVTLTQTVNLA